MLANEKLKLRATFLNGIAIAIFAIGALAPMVSYVTSGEVVSEAALLLLIVLSTGNSGFTHLQAQRTLEDLTDE